MAALAYPRIHDRRDHRVERERYEPYLVPDRERRVSRSDTAASTAAPTAASPYLRRRLLAAVLAVLVVGAGVWLADVTMSDISTALRGLEGRPLSTPGLASAGQPAAAVGAAGGLAGGAGGQVPAVHVVQPGETLWGIARQLQPTGDVRPLVDRLAARHGPGPLQPGERLVLR